MKLRQEYLHTNPFVGQSVLDDQIWAEATEDLYDVYSINERAFDQLKRDLGQLRDDHQTRLRFVVGPAGSGKSHLFARLRRELVDEHFTFAALPPQDPASIKRFVLRKVVEGLKHRARDGANVLGYSQLERFVYALLLLIGRFRGLSIQQIHRNWSQIPRIKYGELLEEFVNCLHQFPSVSLSLPVRRVLFRVLDPEKRDLAVNWLTGSPELTANDHETLGVGGPIDDNEIFDILNNLGKLGAHCGPIILIFDQLDAIDRDECIREIEQLTISFKDYSRCWYVVISLLEEKFPLWRRTLSEAFLTRFGELEQQGWKHHLIELSLINEHQQKELLQKRLSNPELAALRNQDGISDTIYPFTPAHLDALTSKGITSPRAVLKDAEASYRSLALGKPTVATPLPVIVGQILTEIYSSYVGDEPPIDTASVADRVTELFDVLHFPERLGPLKVIDGPLKRSRVKFSGSDKEYSTDSVTIRVVCHDIQGGKSFPNLLSKLTEADSRTILVRDGRVATSGKKTVPLLQQYRSNREFLHLSLDEVRRLHALGQFLANMRQGDYLNERTQPEPSEDNIRACLASIDLLSEMGLAQVFRRLLGGESWSSNGGENRTEATPPPPDELVNKVRQIMRREGWLCFERLLYRIHLEGVAPVTVEKLVQALDHDSLRHSLEIHPHYPDFPKFSSILIWVED